MVSCNSTLSSTLSLMSYSSSDFPLSFLVSHVSGSTYETCKFNACLMLFPLKSLDFIHFQCHANSAVPCVQKKFGMIYYQLKNYEPKCHSCTILTSFAGSWSWRGNEGRVAEGLIVGLSLTGVPPENTFPSKNLFASPSPASASVAWSSQASCMVVNFAVKGSIYFCPTLIVLPTW